jgi:hypothetical protein
MSTATQPPMAYFGGKTKLARRIAARLPSHEHYVEPFAGSLAVLLAKQPSRIETVSDLDGDLVYLDMSSRRVPSRRADVCGIFIRAGLAGPSQQPRDWSQLAESHCFSQGSAYGRIAPADVALGFPP